MHRNFGLIVAIALTGCAVETVDPDDGLGPIGKADGVESAADFFAPDTFYFVRVDGWPDDRMSPASLEHALSFPGAELNVYRTRPDADGHCPSPSADDLVFSTSSFSMRTSGNLTNGTPKSSYKLKFMRYRCDDDGNADEAGTDTCRDELADMRALNLKSMWNDVSQMRESLAWGMFDDAGVHAPDHTYARFCVNDRYYGLYSVIEQVDSAFIDNHFGRNDEGNLYKAYWADVGPANLTHRTSGGDDSGAQYFTPSTSATGLPIEIEDGRFGSSRSRCEPGDSNVGSTSVELDLSGYTHEDEVVVSVHIEHEDLDDLRVVIEQDGNERAVLWACEGAWGDARQGRSEAGGTLSLEEDVTVRVAQSTGRAEPNGRWVLRVEDYREGGVGRIVDFSIRRTRTYQLKTNDDRYDEDEVPFQSYDDLAQLVRVINQGDENTEQYRQDVEGIFDVHTFLRWAGLNMLLGAWDNYWATPANYYLYNSGRRGRDGDIRGRDAFMEHPYFHFIPWDYDNSFGIDYFDVNWAQADIVDWEAATAGYYDNGSTSNLPLITNILKNDTFKAYYLDHIEHLLDAAFNEVSVTERIGEESDGRGSGIWDRVRDSAFLEADQPTAGAHTGRQFTNDQVYWNGFRHYELSVGSQRSMGILPDPDNAGGYVRERRRSAREDLERLRGQYPAGSSGAQFPAEPGRLPHIEDRPMP